MHCIWKVPEVWFLRSLSALSPTLTSSCVPIGDRQCLFLNAAPTLAPPPDSSLAAFYLAAVITQAASQRCAPTPPGDA
eukprot:2028421-Pyramimonas_sp.AAC.1